MEKSETNKEMKSEEVWRNFTPKELEAQYSPSKWSLRFGEDEVISKHIDTARERSEEARKDVDSRCGLSYGREEWKGGKLDVYGEKLDGGAPILVYVHGGYWQELNKDISGYIVKPLNKNGIVCVVVGYDLAPSVTLQDIVEEIHSAVKWACNLANGRGSKGVVLAGWSAGAHLVTQVVSKITQQDLNSFDLIRGVVTMSGIFDLRPIVNTYVNAPLHLNESEAWELSPIKRVCDLGKSWARKDFKILVTVAGNESNEFKRQSRMYYEACQKLGLKSDFLEIENVDHFDLVCDLALTSYSLTNKLVNFILTACPKDRLN